MYALDRDTMVRFIQRRGRVDWAFVYSAGLMITRGRAKGESPKSRCSLDRLAGRQGFVRLARSTLRRDLIVSR